MLRNNLGMELDHLLQGEQMKMEAFKADNKCQYQESRGHQRIIEDCEEYTSINSICLVNKFLEKIQTTKTKRTNGTEKSEQSYRLMKLAN